MLISLVQDWFHSQQKCRGFPSAHSESEPVVILTAVLTAVKWEDEISHSFN